MCTTGAETDCRKATFGTVSPGVRNMTWEIEAKGGAKITKITQIEVAYCVETIAPDPLQDTTILMIFEKESGSQTYTINKFTYKDSDCLDDLVYKFYSVTPSSTNIV